jgi:hypothetical protein
MALLAELSERDATGEKAAIYAQMRHLGGVPMVALIFRHLATLPGALEWMWAAIGPAWRSGRLQEAAWRIAREAPLTPIARMHPEALAAAGVDEPALREVREVLVAYNRANPENMLTILCVLRLLEGHRADVTPESRAWTPPAAPGPLAPMVHPRDFTPEVAKVLDLVAAPGEPGGARVVQSLYRHFAHRPAFLALAVTLLRQRFDDGYIGRSASSIHAHMGPAADEIVRSLSAPQAPHADIRSICERFSGAVIPQMIVVGRLLAEALP